MMLTFCECNIAFVHRMFLDVDIHKWPVAGFQVSNVPKCSLLYKNVVFPNAVVKNCNVRNLNDLSQIVQHVEKNNIICLYDYWIRECSRVQNSVFMRIITIPNNMNLQNLIWNQDSINETELWDIIWFWIGWWIKESTLLISQITIFTSLFS